MSSAPASAPISRSRSSSARRSGPSSGSTASSRRGLAQASAPACAGDSRSGISPTRPPSPGTGAGRLGRKGAGDRMLVQIDPEENEILIDGLAGRFHYPEQKATGEIMAEISGAKRVSGIFSHPVDALAYPLSILFPAHEYFLTAMRERAPGGPERKAGSWLGT